MAVFRAAKATLDECYDRIEEMGKTTPSIVKRIQELEDFTKYNDRYIKLVCRTPGPTTYRLDMLEDEVDILIVQNHFPFPEKRRTGPDQYYAHTRQLASMMPKGTSYAITQLVKFAPKLFKKGGKWFNKYTLTEMKGWAPYLFEEIERVKPKVIVAMGTEAIKVLGLPKRSVNGDRGGIHYSPLLGDIPIVITMHPKVLNMIRQNASGAMWGDDYYPVIRRDLHKAIGLVKGDIELRDLEEAVEEAAKNQITVCETLEDVRYWTDFLLKLGPKVFTSWDLETNSLDPWWRGINRFEEEDEARILTSQVGYRRKDGTVHSIVIPLWHRENKGYDPDKAFEIHKEYLQSDSCKVGHNITFDITFLAVTTGVRLNGTILDTLLALHSLDSGIVGCYSLKTAVWDYLLESGFGGYEDLLMVHED